MSQGATPGVWLQCLRFLLTRSLASNHWSCQWPVYMEKDQPLENGHAAEGGRVRRTESEHLDPAMPDVVYP